MTARVHKATATGRAKASGSASSCQSSFRFAAKQVTVSMIEPFAKAGEVHGGWPYWWQVIERELGRPEQVSGFICPAKFQAVGLDGDVTFTTRLNDAGSHVVIDSIQVGLSHQTTPPNFPIPLGLLLKHALIASGARGLQLPPNWTGQVFPGTSNKWTTSQDERFTVIPTSVGRMTKADQRHHDLPDLIGRTRQKRITDDLLREVAKVHQSVDRDRTEAIVDAFYVSPRTARDYISRARSAGFLPDVPDTDRRKARRK